MTQAALKREAEDDQREEDRAGGRWRFTWRQAVYVAQRRWTLAEIHAALGDDAATVLPPLLALRRAGPAGQCAAPERRSMIP